MIDKVSVGLGFITSSTIAAGMVFLNAAALVVGILAGVTTILYNVHRWRKDRRDDDNKPDDEI